VDLQGAEHQGAHGIQLHGEKIKNVHQTVLKTLCC
jgi:hypothetical protein